MKNKNTIGFVLSLITLAVSSTIGCLPADRGTDDEPECTQTSECPQGTICDANGECVGGTGGSTGGTSNGCTMDTQCSNGRICNNGTCKDPPSSTGGTGGTSNGCTMDTQCTNGRICDGGECKTPPNSTGGTGGSTGGTGGSPECTKDTDCDSGCVCENGVCITPPSTGGTGGSFACDVGQKQSCSCSSGTGEKVCLPDRSGFGTCDCPSGGTGGSGSSDECIGTRSVTFRINGSADQKFMMGAEVAAKDRRPDPEAKFYQDWHSYGGDVIGDGSYDLTVTWCANRSLRFQGYLKNPNGSTDAWHYTCDNGTTGLKSGESFTSSAPYVLVDNLNDGDNCQIDP